jgi:hypothetical protein
LVTLPECFNSPYGTGAYNEICIVWHNVI